LTPSKFPDTSFPVFLSTSYCHATGIIQPVIDYVSALVPENSGDRYLPHVSIGLGTIEFLEAMLAAPFDTFTFSPVGASVTLPATPGCTAVAVTSTSLAPGPFPAVDHMASDTSQTLPVVPRDVLRGITWRV
jgi:hypothetical protein